MKKKRRQITDESLQAIISAIKKSAEKVPPGYFTIKDYMKKWNMSETQTRRLISEEKELNILFEINKIINHPVLIFILSNYGKLVMTDLDKINLLNNDFPRFW